ncbi:Lateral organ boundaries domain containing protein [Parasponia andersonii]|uniref:Lateral organ boundaries domain containing protein n=1 Tax=Parasponia andersonii TaxID=3476 RepID=A0A2P5BHU7_PARAD|nr:Lateral organ boundaries domain containing protein [Parasponia andersonii]
MNINGGSSSGSSGTGGGGGGSGGPCGACKFLRRKCVKGCIFAPYFDSEQGTAHFAAVHKVFGASNASKLLLRLPPHKRLDAVVSLCYEALARIRDPVYGCVAHIFTLQHQVVNLQAELAYVQARLSTLQRLPPALPQSQSPSLTTNHILQSSSNVISASNSSMHLDPLLHHHQQASTELTSFYTNPIDDQPIHDQDLHELRRQLVSRGLRVRSSTSY